MAEEKRQVCDTVRQDRHFLQMVSLGIQCCDARCTECFLRHLRQVGNNRIRLKEARRSGQTA